jgi:serine/threonine protein kinase
MEPIGEVHRMPPGEPKGANGVEPGVQGQGRFGLIAELGHGGMADVYLAVMRGPAGFNFNKLLVLKLLRQHLAEDPEFVSLFLREARLSALLNHPNIVHTIEVGQEGGRYFLVMEYLEGQPLSRAMHRLGAELTLPMRARILADVLAGLHYAHELADIDGTPLHVVHRDVSPQNVFLTYDGVVKLVDFGVAKASGDSVQTRGGVVRGKVAYMSPEQVAGEPVDQRADVFAAGVMLWEAMAGFRLWKGVEEIGIVRRLLNDEIPSLRNACQNADPELERICHKAMAFRPHDRYATAADFQADLESHLDRIGERVQARAIGKLVAKHFRDERARIKATIEWQLGSEQGLGRDDIGLERLPTLSRPLESIPPLPGGVPSISCTPTTSSVPRLDAEASASRQPRIVNSPKPPENPAPELPPTRPAFHSAEVLAAASEAGGLARSEESSEASAALLAIESDNVLCVETGELQLGQFDVASSPRIDLGEVEASPAVAFGPQGPAPGSEPQGPHRDQEPPPPPIVAPPADPAQSQDDAACAKAVAEAATEPEAPGDEVPVRGGASDEAPAAAAGATLEPADDEPTPFVDLGGVATSDDDLRIVIPAGSDVAFGARAPSSALDSPDIPAPPAAPQDLGRAQGQDDVVEEASWELQVGSLLAEFRAEQATKRPRDDAARSDGESVEAAARPERDSARLDSAALPKRELPKPEPAVAKGPADRKLDVTPAETSSEPAEPIVEPVAARVEDAAASKPPSGQEDGRGALEPSSPPSFPEPSSDEGTLEVSERAPETAIDRKAKEAPAAALEPAPGARPAADPAHEAAEGPKSRRWIGTVLTGAVIACGVALFWSTFRSDPDSERAAEGEAPHASAPTARDPERSAVAEPPAAPKLVALSVHAVPEGASLVLDGSPFGASPVRRTVARDGKPHRLEARSPGFVSKTEEVVFDRDRTITLVLEKEATPAASSQPEAKRPPVEPKHAPLPKEPVAAPPPKAPVAAPGTKKPSRHIDPDDPWK